MKKHIKNSALLLCIVSGLIIIINKPISVFSHMTDYLPSGGKYYHWKYGNIYKKLMKEALICRKQYYGTVLFHACRLQKCSYASDAP